MQVSFRKILWGSLATVVMAAPAMAEIKIGVIDFRRLFQQSPQALVMQESLRAEFAPRAQQLTAAETAWRTRNEKLQKDAVTMTPEQRSKAEKDLRDSLRELQSKKQALEDDSNAKSNEEMAKVQGSLIEEVRTYAKAQNFDIVVAEGVIYATPTVDITPAVLAALQARAPRPAAAPAGTTPAKPAAKP